MSRRKTDVGGDLFIPATHLPKSPGHPFYQQLNALFRKHGFDKFLEDLCEPYYKAGGRPSIAPGVYFRMLLVGYFEGLGSERGICWRIADSLSLREFIGLDLCDAVPDHSSLCRIRTRFDVSVYESFFQEVLQLLEAGGLLRGKTVGIDATTLEANAALRNIVHRETGKPYGEYIKDLAKAEMEEEGIEGEPDAREARRRDRKRKKKGRNKDWESPSDPDAQITKMKRGNTRLALKVEQAVDMESGAVVAVGLHGGAKGDTKSMPETLEEAGANCEAATGAAPESVVADAGYHSDAILGELEANGQKSYIAVPRVERVFKKGREEERRRYNKNRRLNGNTRGKRLQRARGEKVERPFQHIYDRGGLRRLTLRGIENNRKRILIQVSGFNLGLLLAKAFGVGTPKAFAAKNEAKACLFIQILVYEGQWTALRFARAARWSSRSKNLSRISVQKHPVNIGAFSTAC